MKKFAVIVLALLFGGCPGVPLMPVFGIEDMEKKEKISCETIPERNVQKCEAIKDGKRIFWEQPIPEQADLKKE